ncbi:hypothetical protein [Planctellipticum variicoloris]|uniref:hypothetical protein n=1 Tax=Planctellipticum variicoloris TaxID=3064265 RepID=UPI0030132C26|nr:hypothetical protein SH412_002879 [Planctomycetaceae bacterium SH412]
MRSMKFTLALSFVLATLVSTGCSRGPELGTVHGKVIQNGVAIPFAYVQFTPVDPPGTYGAAYADENGNYSLRFSQTRNGAPVGRHDVLVRTAKRDEIQVEDKNTGLMVTPKLPEGYKANVQVQFEQVVKSGDNQIDLELAAGTALVAEDDNRLRRR